MASQGQRNDKKTLKYKRTLCSFLQITEGSYISTNIIDKNTKNICNHPCHFYI